MSCGAIDLDNGTAEAHGTFSDGEAGGQAAAETPYHGLTGAAENGVIRSAHACIGEVGGAMGEDRVIGRLYVRVGADDSGYLTIEHASHGDFFAGGFGVEIHEHDLDTQLMQAQGFIIGPDERVFQGRLHEGSTLCLHDGDFAFFGIKNDSAGTGGAFGVIARPQQPWLGGEIVDDFCLIPDVVARGDDGGTCAEQIDGDLWRDAASRCGVLAVDDGKIDVFPTFDFRQKLLYGFSTGFANDVAEKEDADVMRHEMVAVTATIEANADIDDRKRRICFGDV